MPIEFEAKTDRELLLLSLKQGNDMLKKMGQFCDKQEAHEGRLKDLELFKEHQTTLCTQNHKPLWKNPNEMVPLSLIIALAAAIGGNTDALVKVFGG